MSTSPPPATKPADSILSYDSNVMLAAIISLLVVILFVLLLHIYAKWFLFRSRRRSRSVLATHEFHPFAIDATHAASPTKGLDSSAISSIPLFVYDDGVVGECAICLSVFEAGERCRRLPGCSHAFHVECIDMWFQSHSTCPICRSCPVLAENGNDIGTTLLLEVQLEIGVDDDRVCNEIELCRAPPSSSSSVAAAAAGESVKRMMSRNRSERKIHPSEALVDSQV